MHNPSAMDIAATDRLIARMLIGLTPRDPLSITSAIGFTVTVAEMAAYIPARRAAKVDPMVELRYE